jgi:peroxiredoxin
MKRALSILFVAVFMAFPGLTEEVTKLPLGAAAPEFTLTDVTTQTPVSLRELSEGKKALVVMFVCRHCPYVQHVKGALSQLAKDYQDQGVGFVAISANDPAAYPEDSPASLAEMAQEESFSFPLLFDQTQAVARAYTARATPDIFIFDADGKLAYRGQLDDTRPNGGKPADGADVRQALDQLLAGNPVSAEQKPAIGCSIKWKS